MTATDPFELAQQAAQRLAEITGVPRHDVALVLGSGWAPAADELGDASVELQLSDLPGFPDAAVAGHSNAIRSIQVGDRRMLAFLGRVHGYEGHPVSTVVHAVRTAAIAGCDVVVLTNAAGGLRDGMYAGQPVLISDHINLTGRSPLTGPPPPAPFASRFVDLTDLYSARLRRLAKSVEPALTDGVYAAIAGPHYETPSEVRMLRGLGADLVGMSTALEAIAARHLGAEVLAMSLVTNLAAGMTSEKLNHEEVLQAGTAAAQQMGTLLAEVVRKLGRP
ncbi:MAG: purine-nucleoside phosphorylase [Mycobacteriales bacterium]